jgi:hypothetical protein
MRKLTRDFWIDKKAVEHKDTESTAVVYLRDFGPYVDLMGFGGKRNKPDFHYTYKTLEAAHTKMNTYFDSIRAWEKAVVDRREKAKAYVNTAKVGDIYVSSWGYDQTNVDFYKITKVMKKMVEYVQIDKSVTPDYLTAEKATAGDKVISKPSRALMGKNGFSVSSFQYASKWNGQPMHQTDILFGH